MRVRTVWHWKRIFVGVLLALLCAVGIAALRLSGIWDAPEWVSPLLGCVLGFFYCCAYPLWHFEVAEGRDDG